MNWAEWTPEISMAVTGRREPTWRDANLRRTPISNLTDDRLISIEHMLIGRGGPDPASREEMFVNWYDVIRNEIDKRGLEMIQEDHPRLLEGLKAWKEEMRASGG